MESALEYYQRRIEGFESMSFEQRREAISNKLNLHDKQHTRSTLKALFRMKPRPDAKSEYGYKNYFGKYVDCYRVDQCVPMRALSKKSRSEKQREASEKLVHRNEYRSRKNLAALLARQWIERDVAIIDTETTSLNGRVIQIAVVSARTGEVQYQSYVYTDMEIEQSAFEVHGIDKTKLERAPTFDRVAMDIDSVLGERQWGAYNTQFDEHVMRNSLTTACRWIERSAGCAMYDIAAEFFGPTNKYGSIALSSSLFQAGLKYEGRAHEADVDAVATARLIQYVASHAIDE